MFRSASEQTFPHFASSRFGHSDGSLNLLPKPMHGKVPTLAVGRSQQTLDWIATHMDGYMGFVPEPARLKPFVREWNDAVELNKAVDQVNPVDADGKDNCVKPLALGGFSIFTRNRTLPSSVSGAVSRSAVVRYAGSSSRRAMRVSCTSL
ncbi:hypothetical protein [Paraburkholderia humisilvae]|uniref:Uncharacterized protein n=1 Tax=Paraburkholderia humisilvae TaxID=627669 RepID=A0A6J5E8J4_9BURK|nr:hypothetical protein [Paraburkholderia humisilvae]CAB3762167.1 hypothetical protein LMG29542_04261 [Paraburkholderia humisilvae]